MIGPIKLYIKSTKNEKNLNEILLQLNTDINKFLFSRDKKYIFEFNNVKNQYYAYGSHFLSRGSNATVFSIIDKTCNFKNCILKLTNEPSDEFLECIEKFINDKHTHTNNIMDIYLWGMLHNNINDHIANYMIVKEYLMFTSENINTLTLEHRLNMIYDFTLFLTKLSQKNIYLRDLKIQNIGFDATNNNHKIVIIDYDNLTTLNDYDVKTLIKSESKYGIIMCSGTYVPYYLTSHYNNIKTLFQKKEKFTKIHKFMANQCNSVIEAKFQTLNDILEHGKYSEKTELEIRSFYDKHTNLKNLADDLFTKLNDLNYLEYQNILINLTNELHKVASVPLAIITAKLLYTCSPIEESIKINEHENFKNVLINISPYEYEKLFIKSFLNKSLLSDKNDDQIITQILSGLLKANYKDVLSYSQIIELLNKLTYFSSNKF